MDARCASVMVRAMTILAVFCSACDSDDETSKDGAVDVEDASADSGHTAAEHDAGPGQDRSTVDEEEGETPSGTADTDYAKAEHWLCRPGHNEICEMNLDTTVVKSDGSLEVERFEAKSDPAFDCFYVYPTVSLDATGNSDLVPGQEEINVVRAQFARFASECRLFAPIYRQVTLTSLRASLSGMMSSADRTLGYRDVLAAWKHYLKNDNDGRGVVLIGHSQGSSVLLQLLKEQLDKEAVDDRLISALIIGMNTLVPKDKVVGGTLKHIPLCESDDQLGCIISYASFRESAPPPDSALFGTSTDPNLVAGCTNPAAIGGGSAELHAYLSAGGPGASSTPMPDWVDGKTIDTPFVSVPGLLSAECKFAKTGSYLSITVKGDDSDPRADDIVGDVVSNGQVSADWGLHLIDVHLAMGNLIDQVRTKAAAYANR